MNDWSMLKKLIWLHIVKGGGSALRTVTGALIHVTNALALPAEALSVNVEPIQAGSGDPSPDNVRPISGRTSATVTRTGKNLLAKPFVFRPIPSTLSDCFFIKAGTYTFSFQSIGSATTWRFGVSMFDKDGNALNDERYKPHTDMLFVDSVVMWYTGRDITYKTVKFTFIEDCYTRIWFGSGETTSSMDATGAILELGSTASAYEPYQGNTYTIQLGDTVYGGTLDVTGGKMVVDRAIYDLGTAVVAPVNGSEDARSQGLFSAYGYTPPVARVTDISAVTAPDGIICNQFVAAPNNAFLAPGRSPAEPSFSQYASSFYVQWNGLAGKTNADAKALLTGTQIAAPLATPIEITLTPTQIDMLLGENNLWADAGDLTLTYYADGNASTSEALGILLGGTYNNPGGADDVSDDEALGILLGGS